MESSPYSIHLKDTKMKNLDIKSAIISASIVWTLAVIAFVASYLVPVMSDPDVQANWVLSIALIPSALLGAHIYYRKGHKTNGFLLGAGVGVANGKGATGAAPSD